MGSIGTIYHLKIKWKISNYYLEKHMIISIIYLFYNSITLLGLKRYNKIYLIFIKILYFHLKINVFIEVLLFSVIIIKKLTFINVYFIMN